MAEYYDKIDANLINTLKYQPQTHMGLKVELLDYLETTIGEVTQDIDRSNAGSVEINYQQGVRRSCSITLINKFNLYTPSFNRGIWLHTKFKVYMGFYIGVDIYWFSQGIYILTNPSVLNERSNKTITLNGVDKFGILGSETSFHELNGTYKIPAGTTLKNAVKSLLKMPIGNSGGNLIVYGADNAFTGAQYYSGWLSNRVKNIFGYTLTNLIPNIIPSTIKEVYVDEQGDGNHYVKWSPNAYTYDAGTCTLNIPTIARLRRQYSNALIKIIAYSGYPIDPKPPVIDNRIVEYYDAIEFLGQDEVKWDTAQGAPINHYYLRDNDGFLPVISYSSAQPFYKVYLNRQEIPYMASGGSGVPLHYEYNPTTKAIWIIGTTLTQQLSATATISIIAKMRGSIGDIKIPYDIEKSPNEFYADLIIELATITACDVYYDAYGYLNFVKGNEKQDMDNLPTVWDFSDESNYYFNSSLDYNFTNVFNVIKVVGTNDSAKDICEKTVKNTQLNSPTCVQLLGEKIKYIESSFCYNQPRTEDFANYLLQKYSRVQETLNFGTIPLPFLDVNQVINITDKNLDLNEARFIIQSLSLPLSTDSEMTVNSTNTANIPYFEAQGG